MKTAILCLAIALLIPAAARAGDYVIDSVNSFVNFSLGHMKVGKTHGRFNIFSGKVKYSPTDDIAESTLEFTLQAASLDTGNKKRDAHLVGKNFFKATKFPTITFKSTSVSGDKITGNLTLLGVTKKIEARFQISGLGVLMENKKEILGATATFSIKRSDFGMKHSLHAIGDDIDITVSIEAQQK